MIPSLYRTLGFVCSLFVLHLTYASPIDHPQPSPAAISLPLIARQKRVYVPHNYDKSNSTKRFRVEESSTWKGALYYDTTEYLIEVGIGTSEPPQKFYFMLDTGSNVMWVYSNGCPEEQCRRSRFNYEIRSSTYKSSWDQICYNYLDGTFIVGYLGKDVITVGTIQVKDQLFVSVDEAIGVLHYDAKQDINSIGMFGLAYSSKVDTRTVVPTYYETPLGNMKKQGLIPKGMFSMYLGPDTKQDLSKGHILIGDYDINLIKEEPKFVSTRLDETSGLSEEYALYIEGFSLLRDAPSSIQDDHTQTVIQAVTQRPSSNAIDVIQEWNFSDRSDTPTNIAFDFDTGTTESFFYASYTIEMFKLITGTTEDPKGEDWDIDCSYQHSDTYLRLRISHEHKKAEADPDPNPLYLDVPISAFVKKKKNEACKCQWTLGVKKPEEGSMMLGQDFLRYFYLVHDFDNFQLGFAVPNDRSSRVSLKNNA
ncbi:hypothetical protein MUCCIDRAFT_93158 [Mucor lusitanicus CBS 277.49]|uniref:Peptidase A1 domain-containing protein n=1 Tax=Mucor lusitanicus CBS 277.49 TaxID=747725 RepID=A0A168GGP1_MUCCL|nr:hypothetical protein MUCCIDRAFT_93158 [Mucor lusitanicus CBS 277.49]